MGDGKIVRARVRNAPVTKQVDAEEINELIAKSLEPDDTRTREMDPATFRALLREQRGGQPTPPVPELIVAEPPPEPIVAEPGPDRPEPWLALAMAPPLEEPRAPDLDPAAIRLRSGLVVALVLAIAAAIAILLLR